MKKWTLLSLLVLMIPALLTAGGSKESASPEDPGRPVRIAVLNGPSGIGLIQLMENPPLQEEGLAVETEAIGAPKVLLGQLIKEEWDFAVLPANMAALIYNKGVPYQVAAVTGLGNLYLISDSDSRPESLKDLDGRTVNIPGKNTTPDLIMQLLGDKEGVAIAPDYSFNPSDLAKALAGGVAQSGVLPEPMATIALSKNPGLSVALDLQAAWEEAYPGEGVFPLTILVVRKEFAGAHPVLTAEILKAAEASIFWVTENPADASVLIGEHGFTLPAPVVAKAIPRSNYTFLEGEEAAASAEHYFGEVFRINPGALGGKLPGEELYLKP